MSLHLSDGSLGLTLFAVPAGAVLTLVMSGRIVDKFGAARVERIAGLLVAVALVTIGLGPQTHDLPVLVAALAWFGVVAGLLDVSMNTSATATSRPATRSTRAAPNLSTIRPLITSVSTLPAGTANSVSPRRPSLRCSDSLIAGSRALQVAVAAPRTKKWPNTAILARRSSWRSRCHCT